jgi:undecaprenyl pyrophosphate phosphatase UppP
MALVCLALLPINAFAYLDPGTGSAMLQGILGALAAIAMVLKLYWHRLLRMLGLRKDVMKKEADSDKK